MTKGDRVEQIEPPSNLAAMTPAWFTQVFAARHPGVVVTHAVPLDIIAATATKARLQLSYNEVGQALGLPQRLIAKGGLYGHVHETQLYPLYRNEARFYRDVAPRLTVDVPRCYYSDTTHTGLVLLEDLTERGARFGRPSTPMTAELVADSLEYQARYHACFWNQRSALDALQLLNIDGLLRSYFQEPFLVDCEPPQGTHSPATLRTVQAAREAMKDRRFFQHAVLVLNDLDERDVQCLTHFDAHPGNMYFTAANQPCWLDWQSCARYAWAWDVTYFIVGALSVEDRRRHERELLKHYLGCLRQHGVRHDVPSDEVAWLSYRRHAIWGLFWALIPNIMQSHVDGFPVVERFWAAVHDLETLKCLGLTASREWCA
ncbi:MAG: oxidoreductase family protein [Steroidobacteraceae bacterium]